MIRYEGEPKAIKEYPMFPSTTKILVVDDMLTMRKIVSNVCKNLGFTDIETANDGEMAWEKIKSGNYGLVISDCNMPNCTGVDLLKRVRSDQKLSELAFIMVTAEAEAGQIKEAIDAKVDAYVVKPFTPDTLKKKFELISAKKVGNAA
jgi:two-component system, chemotaxis family, chemotaxis protein CheY